MTELDQVWSQILDDAASKASLTGRHHVAEYLRLRAANDAIRAEGSTWLLNALVEIASSELAHHKNLVIERESGHTFPRGTSRMVGNVVRLRQGVRCLTLEAGWARSPNDGVMAGGAMAFAKLSHFGMPRRGAEFKLVYDGSFPHWLDQSDEVVDSSYLRRHLEIFLQH